jgi:TusA-related sulfurtransferase
LKTKRALASAAPGAAVVVLVTDPDSELDIRAHAQLNSIACAVSGPVDGVWRFELTKP